MAIPAASAARTLCELRDWNLSNLELQKILFIAHMFHLGTHGGEPLVNESFEAWDYGPVLPSVYRRVRGFGSSPVRNVFHGVPATLPETPEYETLANAANATRGISAGRLVDLTHRVGGAWANNYLPGVRGIVIPNRDILNEFNLRARQPQQAA